MAMIQLTVSQLKAKKEKLETLNKKYYQELQALQQDESTLQAMWEGDAASAFDAGFKKDLAQLLKYYELIRKYIQALEEIIRKYTEAERKNIQTVKTR